MRISNIRGRGLGDRVSPMKPFNVALLSKLVYGHAVRHKPPLEYHIVFKDNIYVFHVFFKGGVNLFGLFFKLVGGRLEVRVVYEEKAGDNLAYFHPLWDFGIIFKVVMYEKYDFIAVFFKSYHLGFYDR